MIRCSTATLLAAALLVLLPSRPSAHEIPPHVTVLAFLRPEGQRLRVLVRVPLEAMRDVDFPLSTTGFLDLERVQPLLGNAAKLWIADYLEIYENGQLLEIVEVGAARVSLPSDRSFSAWEDAMAHIIGAPLPPETEITWRQAMLDVLFEYPIESEASEFAIHPGLAHLGIRTATVLRYGSPGGAERAFRYTGDPGLVRLDPRSHQAFFHFMRLGFFHILEGIDHLLFVLCLVIPFRRFRPLVAIVTSFTVAHSITLIASALGFAPNALWFPPLIETLIALSIVYLAFENIVGAARKTEIDTSKPAKNGGTHSLVGHRWLVAFVFGLVHGFGFSFLLRDSLQFAGSHLATSLLAFNAGVELGQVFVLALAIPLLSLLFLYVVPERIGTILLSALVAHTAWHWMTERGAQLAQYDFQWPALDMSLVASLMRGLMIVLILLAAVWLTYVLIGRLVRPTRQTEPPVSSVERP